MQPVQCAATDLTPQVLETLHHRFRREIERNIVHHACLPANAMYALLCVPSRIVLRTRGLAVRSAEALEAGIL